MAQWLRLCTPNAAGQSSTPGWETWDPAAIKDPERPNKHFFKKCFSWQIKLPDQKGLCFPKYSDYALHVQKKKKGQHYESEARLLI